MNALPMALRERIRDAVDGGDASAAQVADRFGVAVNTVYNLLRLRQETGSLRPRPNPGGHPPAIGPERYDEVRQLLAAQPDLTLGQLRDRLGLDCSLAAVCRTLKQLGLSRKKKRSGRPNSSGPTSRPSGKTGPSGRPN
jgi:transposase